MAKTGYYSDGYFNNSDDPVPIPTTFTGSVSYAINISEAIDDGKTRAYHIDTGITLADSGMSDYINTISLTGVHSLTNYSFLVDSTDSTITGFVANTGIDSLSSTFVDYQRIAANKYTNGVRASGEGVSLDPYPFGGALAPIDSTYFLTYKGIFATLFCVEKVWRNGRPARGIFGLNHKEAFIKSIPLGEIIAQDGTQYYVDSYTNRIRKITPDGLLTTIAGSSSIPLSSVDDYARSTDGIGASAVFSAPRGVAVDNSNQYLYVTDSHAVRRVPINGNEETFTQSGILNNPGFQNGIGADDGRFYFPQGIIIDQNHDLYVADTGNHCIRKISTTGENNQESSTFAGTPTVSGNIDGQGVNNARFNLPYDLIRDSNGNYFITDCGNNSIRKIDSEGNVTTFAGSTAGEPGYIDSTSTDARFNSPQKITIDNQDNLYVVDMNNYAIRKIDTDGVVTTINILTENTNIDDRTPLNFGLTVSSSVWLEVQDFLWSNYLSSINPYSMVSATTHPLFEPVIESRGAMTLLHYGTPRTSLSGVQLEGLVDVRVLAGDTLQIQARVKINKVLNWKNILPPTVFEQNKNVVFNGLTLLTSNAARKFLFLNKGVPGTDWFGGIFYRKGYPGIGVTRWGELYKYNRRTTGITNKDNNEVFNDTDIITTRQKLSASEQASYSTSHLTFYRDGIPFGGKFTYTDGWTPMFLGNDYTTIPRSSGNPIFNNATWYTFITSSDLISMSHNYGSCIERWDALTGPKWSNGKMVSAQ